MQTLEAILAAHPFFKDFSSEHLQLMVSCARNVRYPAGSYLFHESEPADHFYLIREGVVALETTAAQRQPVTIETIEVGEVLGWSWLFPPYRWHFSARVVEPIRAIALDGTCLRTKAETDHELGYQLTRRVAQIMLQRLQATRLQFLDIYQVPTEGADA